MASQICSDLICGAYDLHIHPSPSHFPRLMDDFEILEQAEKAGMAGVLLKNHYETTCARALLANSHHKGFKSKAYGAAVLNHPLGGLNPYAVYSALEMGAKVIFLPTRDAANSLKFGDMPGDFFRREGISILDDKGGLKPEIYEIFEIVKLYGAVLSTGHVSPKEAVIVCREGRAHNVRMSLTHPEWYRTIIDINTQRELADLGVYIEKCWLNIAEGMCPAPEMAAHIHAVGAKHCFLSTDRGQAGHESPVKGMEQFIDTLLQNGVSKCEIKTMTHDVPSEMLDVL